MDCADGLEELRGLADRHVEHFGNVLALVVHGERFAVVPRSPADLTGHVDVRQEVHLDLDRAVTRTVLTAAAFDVKAESSWQVSPGFRLQSLGEERADAIEDTGIGRGIGAWRAADRRLVDVHDLVEVFEAGHARVLAGNLSGSIELVCEHPIEDVVDERRLAGATHSRDHREGAERKCRRDVFEIVGFGALYRHLAIGVDRPSAGRCRD